MQVMIKKDGVALFTEWMELDALSHRLDNRENIHVHFEKPTNREIIFAHICANDFSLSPGQKLTIEFKSSDVEGGS